MQDENEKEIYEECQNIEHQLGRTDDRCKEIFHYGSLCRKLGKFEGIRLGQGKERNKFMGLVQKRKWISDIQEEHDIWKARQDFAEEVLKITGERIAVLTDARYADTYERHCMAEEVKWIQERIEAIAKEARK